MSVASTPRATYRLQLRREFGFADAARIVPYVARLGASHLYLSPILAARAGSAHGYDGVDPGRIAPELGGEDGYRALVEACRAHGLGVIVDIVPNHLAVGGADNLLWLDLLENGAGSRFARVFDVDWETRDPALRGKVAAPFLGEPYGEALEAGEIRLVFDEALGRLCAAYHHHRFPLAPASYAEVLREGGEALAPLAARFEAAREADEAAAARAALARAGAPLEAALAAWNEDRDRLHDLLERQNWRLAWWRTAGDEINWRRFFEIAELAGVRVEDEEVFEAVHATIFRLYAQGLVDGLRVDHVDGLADPAGYCARLRARLSELERERPEGAPPGPAYVVVEKILAEEETLPVGWGVDGTTGYDFLASVGALLHDPEGEDALTDLWVDVSGRAPDFASEERAARLEMLEVSFAGQLDACAHAFHDLARRRRETRDVTYHAIRRALVRLVAAFPAYRTYATAGAAPGSDAPILARAVAEAKAASAPGEAGVVDLVAGWISGFGVADEALRARAVAAFQQLCAPVAAKAVEDTAFYRYGRLLSRCDVGCDPGRFALPREAFHAQCMARAAEHPSAMLATATHDHKRGEDARARLAALSEVPAAWAEHVAAWMELNRERSRDAVDPADEYALYQALVGAWPLDLAPDDAQGLSRLAERLSRFSEKALREAKLSSSWSEPNAPYEEACRRFVEEALDPAQSGEFLQSVHDFVDALAPIGAANGLAQTFLRATTPGVPDTYQGRELWDFSLVDPDNREPVDYAAREAALGSQADWEALLADWRDGRVKQRLLVATLGARRALPELFAKGDYAPLEVRGRRAAHVVAFARRYSSSSMVALCGRWLAEPLMGGDALAPDPEWWEDTTIVAPDDVVDAELDDALGEGRPRAFRRETPVAELLGRLPAGLWIAA